MYIVNALRRAAQVRPNHPATIFKGRTRTYGQVLDRVARLAGAFNSLGLKEDARIGILAQNSDRYFEYSFAVPYSGRTMVPLNTRLAVPELLYMMEHSEVEFLFFDDAFVETYPEFRNKATGVEHFVYMGDGDTPAGVLDYENLIAENNPVQDAGRRMDELLGIYYTGGTTGLPKGVMLSHGNMANNAMCMMMDIGFTESSDFLHVSPMFHLADVGPSYGLTALGGTHHFFPVFDVDNLLKVLVEEKITDLALVPAMIGMLVNHPTLQAYDLSNLQGIIYGASPIPESILKKAIELFPSVKFTQFYGQTEVTASLSVLRPEYHVFEGRYAGKLRSAGQPTYSILARIVDSNDKEVPRGMPGEILCRSPGNMMGYLKNPKQTAETIHDGWLHTGDVGYMDEDGFIFVVDRLKDMIVTGGENVHSSEVEHAVASHPGVAEVAAIGIPSEKWGEQVHVEVVPKPGIKITGLEIIDHCRNLIGGYKCPKSVEIRSGPLPLSGAGKVQKTVLREPYWKETDRKVH